MGRGGGLALPGGRNGILGIWIFSVAVFLLWVDSIPGGDRVAVWVSRKKDERVGIAKTTLLRLHCFVGAGHIFKNYASTLLRWCVE